MTTYAVTELRLLAPDVQDALADLIADNLSAGVPCSVGYPPGGLEATHVWVSGDFDADLPSRISGGKQRDEDGLVEVRVIVSQSETLFAPPRDAALVIVGQIEDVLVADPTLGGVVGECHLEHVKGAEAIPDKTLRQYGVTLTIAYTGTAHV